MILHIETATDICSVSLSMGNELVDSIESSDGRNHAKFLTVFINDILLRNDILATGLEAVAVSKGPGSYTGLRIGVSVAKGICYGAGIPLISVPTLEAMFFGMKKEVLLSVDNIPFNSLFAPMIDARRMEVYTSIFSFSGEIIKETAAVVVDDYTFSAHLDQNPLYFFGSGADKLRDIILHENAYFVDNFKHSSSNMIELANERLILKKFEDLAYFEPFYLKDFITTTPKKSILGQAQRKRVEQ